MKASAFLALRYIKVQKKHSLFIVICVALSVALTAFSLIAFSTVTGFSKQAAERTYGSWEAMIGGLTDEQAETLSRNAAFSEAQTVPYPVVDLDMIQENEFIGDVWYSYPLIITVNDKTNVSATGIADISLLPEQIFSGRVPENENEIVVNKNSSFDIGDTVTVSIQYVKRHYETDRLDSQVDEVLDSKSKTYTVCGRAAEDEVYGNKIYCFPQDDFFTTGIYMRRNALFVKFTDTSLNYRTEVVEICEKAGVQLTSVTDVSNTYHFTVDYAYMANMCFLNDEYNLAAAAGSEARSDLLAWSALMYIVVLLILAAGRMIIDCEFELCSAKMHKQLGLLMSVGASDRQLVEITVIQGLILGIIAVPLGLLLGYLFAAAALYALMSDGNIAHYFGQIAGTVKLSVDPVLMLLAGITGIGWVFFSAYGTAVRIKKVNPTEAVRGMRKKGRLPYPKRKASEKITPQGFIKAMALSTMKIERKRFIVSTAAMTVSIVFFTIITFGVHFAQSYLSGVLDYYGIDPGLYEAFSIHREMSQQEIKELAAQINDSGYFHVNNMEIVGEPRIEIFATTDELLGIHKDDGYERYASYDVTVFPIKREHYDTLFADTGISYDEAIEKRYAFKITGEGEYDGKVPDSLTNTTVLTNSRIFRDDEKVFDMNIISLPNADENDIRTIFSRGVIYGGYSGIYYCYMPEEILYDYIEDFKDEELTFHWLSFALYDIYDYTNAIEWLDDNIPYYYDNNYSELTFEFANLRVITVIGYAVVIVAALIAISNIVNITVSGITENRQGFALLKAAGMDDGQIEKTAVIQSIYPAAGAALAALFICALLIFAFFFGEYAVGVRKSLAGLYEAINPFFHPMKEILFALRQYIIAAVSAAAVSLLAGIGPIKEIENAPIAEAVKAEE